MPLIDAKKWQKRAKKVLKKIIPTPKSLILMYHRIEAKDIDPWSLAVTPEHFTQHLEILKKHTQPLSLQELSQAHQAGKVPERALSITFDDGYANNLYNAKPILDQYQIPATVFVSNGYTEKQREYWWDELDNIFFQPGQLPDQLTLTIQKKLYKWHLGKAVNYTENEQKKDYDSRAERAKPNTRMSLYYSVWKALQNLTNAERENVINSIIEWANYKPILRLSHRPMTREELPMLESSGFIKIGAHTVNHPLLFAHSLANQKQEIEESKAYLERALNHSVTTFAYPFGAYDQKTISLVKASGFTCACSTVEETVWQWSDSYQLPRFEVIDWDSQIFEQKLLNWLENE